MNLTSKQLLVAAMSLANEIHFVKHKANIKLIQPSEYSGWEVDFLCCHENEIHNGSRLNQTNHVLDDEKIIVRALILAALNVDDHSCEICSSDK